MRNQILQERRAANRDIQYDQRRRCLLIPYGQRPNIGGPDA